MLPGVLSSGTTQYPLQHSRRRGLPPCPATTHAITFAVEPLCFVVQADVAWPYSLEPPQTLLFRNRPRCFLVFSPLVPPSIHCRHSRRRGLPPCPATTHAITFAVEPLCFVVQADVAWPYSLEPPQTLLFRNRPRCFLVFSPLVPPSIHCSILAGAGSRPVQPPLTPLHLLLNHCVLLCRLMWHGRIALNRHNFAV